MPNDLQDSDALKLLSKRVNDKNPIWLLLYACKNPDYDIATCLICRKVIYFKETINYIHAEFTVFVEAHGIVHLKEHNLLPFI